MEVASEQEMREFLANGHNELPRILWEHLPDDSIIRYTTKEKGKSEYERFHEGGYLKGFLCEDGEEMLKIGKRPNYPGHPYRSPVVIVKFKDIDRLWKKYAQCNAVELILISNSLARKSAEVEELQARVERLEKLIAKK